MVTRVICCSLLFLVLLQVALAAPAYRLAAEDQLIVAVLNHADAGGTVTVAPDGTIQLPIVGQLSVLGLTLEEVRTTLVTRYGQRFRNPEITVTLTQPREVRVYVLGAVKNPSVYPLTPGARITELLAAAGGLTISEAEARALLLRAANGASVSLNLRAALAGQPDANLLLEPGDVLSIERTPTLPVYVTGMVLQPGLLALPEGSTVSQALALAGGLRLRVDEVRFTLVRGATRIPVQANDTSPLHSGDELRVESTLLPIFVSGEVSKPNRYELREGLGLVEALTLAGGCTPLASQSGVIITHADGKTETVDTIELAARGGNVTLRADDLITVPRNTARITILGGVQLPGAVPLDERHPLRLTEAIAHAQGTTKLAQLKHVRIMRATVPQGSKAFTVNVEGILRKGHMENDLLLQNGDVVYVPDGKTDPSLLLSVFTTLGLLKNAIF